MPIYEYRCAKCGFQQEYLQRINEAPLTKCPECGKKSFNKMVTAAGFQLKGTGWYVTDFRNNGASGSKKEKDKSADGASKEAATKESPAKESKSKESAKSGSGGASTPTS